MKQKRHTGKGRCNRFLVPRNDKLKNDYLSLIKKWSCHAEE